MHFYCTILFSPRIMYICLHFAKRETREEKILCLVIFVFDAWKTILFFVDDDDDDDGTNCCVVCVACSLCKCRSKYMAEFKTESELDIIMICPAVYLQ